MESNNAPQMEDYGSPGSRSEDSQANSNGGENGNIGTNQPSGTGGGQGAGGVEREGAQFGEFGETGQGTDLTVEMENTDFRSGMIKGGQEGADDAAGPGQYGGSTGGVGEQG